MSFLVYIHNMRSGANSVKTGFATREAAHNWAVAKECTGQDRFGRKYACDVGHKE